MTFAQILVRRRRFDFWLLLAGFAALAILNSAGKGIFLVFAVCGIYLAIFRRRTWRYAPPAFTLAVIAYCVWSIGLSLLRGEPLDGNRLLSYAAIELAVVFLPLGLCLVRRPIDAMVAGARVGLIALAVMSSLEFALSGQRVGLGGNEAILAFLAAASGLIARIPAGRTFRFLPNGRWWVYVSLLPVVLTQTRAAWLIYLVVLALDLLALTRLCRRQGRSGAFVAGGVGLVALLAMAAGAGFVVDRVQQGLSEIERFESTGEVVGSADVRLVMWKAGLELLGEHPLIGVGATERVEQVAARTGENALMVVYYKHLHNIFLDEALSSGLIGLALLFAIFATFLVLVVRGSENRLLRETCVVFVLLVFSFGSFHGVLINEWMIIQIFGMMSVVLSQLRRDALEAPRRHGSLAT